MPGFDDYKNDATKGSELKDLMVLVASRMKVSDSVVAEVLNRLVTRIEALESLVGSDVVGKEDLQKYAKQVQAAKTFSPDRTKTLSAMSQNDNGEMSATFAEVQATVVSQNNYTSPGSTKTALSTIFGKIWNFIGRLRTSWQATPDDTHFPSEKLVKDSLDGKENTANKTSFIRGLSEADDTRFPTEYATRFAIESTRSLIEKYLRVHCEGIIGVGGWTSINLYSYDSNAPVINTPSGLTDNIFSTILYKQIDASHTWDPCNKGCEDFLVIKQGHQQEATTYFQLGSIFELPQVRRFKMRLYNNESYRWTVSICHTRTNAGEYTGDIIFSTNKSGRYESNLDIIIEPKRCITIEVLISTSYYNDLSIPVVFVSTNEEIAS